MADQSQTPAAMSAPSTQEQHALQQALLDSARLFATDVARFARDWQTRWSDPALTQQLDEISAALQAAVGGLVAQFSRQEGPSQTQVAGYLWVLRDTSGPLARLQTLTGADPAAMSLEDQRLLSEVDTLSIQLNGFRAQWQDYLSLATGQGPDIARHPTAPFLPPLPPNPARAAAPAAPSLPPFPFQAALAGVVGSPPDPGLDMLAPDLAPPDAGPGESLQRGLSGTAKVTLTLLLLVVLIAFLAYQFAARLPQTTRAETPTAATPGTTLSAPTPTITAQPTSPPTPAPSPTATAQPSPTVTLPPGGGGTTQLSVNPPALLVPCPATGAATLQLVDTGAQPLDWQATPIGASGGSPVIFLDGQFTEHGHLNPGEVAQISVTAQVRGAQGIISMNYTGGSSPVTVSYSVNC